MPHHRRALIEALEARDETKASGAPTGDVSRAFAPIRSRLHAGRLAGGPLG